MKSRDGEYLVTNIYIFADDKLCKNGVSVYSFRKYAPVGLHLLIRIDLFKEDPKASSWVSCLHSLCCDALVGDGPL
jgi:hypothetical protein